MPFKYRLQKVIEFRIRKKEEQEAIVSRARQKLRLAEKRVEENKLEIVQVSTAQRTADYTMMEYYDKYLHHLWEVAEKLEEERKQAEEELQIEIQKLIECEQNVKVLEKHKERKKEEYLKEEKEREMKELNETASIKHFRKQKEQQEEQELEEYLRIMKVNDEYEY